jgi:hypothetical protein
MNFKQIFIISIVIFLIAILIEYLLYKNLLGFIWINFLEFIMFLIGVYVGTKLENKK